MSINFHLLFLCSMFPYFCCCWILHSRQFLFSFSFVSSNFQVDSVLQTFCSSSCCGILLVYCLFILTVNFLSAE